MKKFFKEYGAVTIAIFALLVLVAMITPVGNIIKTSLQGTTSKFAAGMNNQTDDALNATLALQEDIKKVPIAETIYWGIDDTGKLTISDQEVGGEYSGSFARDKQFANYNSVPWYLQRENVNSVKILKVKDEIMPKSLENWFYELRNCSYIDVTDLNTSETENMRSLFYYTGRNLTSSFEIIGLNSWDTSKVKNMSMMFSGTGFNASSWHIGDLSNWDVSSVKNMAAMFHSAGHVTREWNIGNLSNWDVSNATDMSALFFNSGYNSNIWHVGDLSNWNVSNVTDMSSMFGQAGMYSQAWYAGNLSKWDTSKVQKMGGMFYGAGYKDQNFTLDLSNWDVKKVTNYNLFNNYVETKITPPIWVN